MNAVRDKAALCEKSVQKVAKGEVEKHKKKRAPRRVFNSPVKVTRWSDDVDPRIVAHVKALGIHHSLIEVVSPQEIIIHNNSIISKNGRKK